MPKRLFKNSIRPPRVQVVEEYRLLCSPTVLPIIGGSIVSCEFISLQSRPVQTPSVYSISSPHILTGLPQEQQEKLKAAVEAKLEEDHLPEGSSMEPPADCETVEDQVLMRNKQEFALLHLHPLIRRTQVLRCTARRGRPRGPNRPCALRQRVAPTRPQRTLGRDDCVGPR